MLYEHAKLFNDRKAYRVVVEKCIDNLCSVKTDSHLMKVSNAQFWLDVLQSKSKAREHNHQQVMSTLISAFCSQHKDELDAETFLNLTDQSVLPTLSVEAAMDLMALEMSFVPAPSSADDLSNLQKRGLSDVELVPQRRSSWF